MIKVGQETGHQRAFTAYRDRCCLLAALECEPFAHCY